MDTIHAMGCGCAGPTKPLLIPSETVDASAPTPVEPTQDDAAIALAGFGPIAMVEGPDLPANASTTGTVAIGDPFEGTLSPRGDLDWIAIDLVAGEAVEILLTGTGTNALDDPFLSFYDPNGVLLASNDDGGGGLNSALVVVAQQTGTYYIEADSYQSAGRGGYTVTVNATTPPPPADLLDAIDWGGQTVPGADDGVITVYFAPSGTRLDGYTSEGFNAYERAQFIAALDYISSVADITFEITTDPTADLRLVLDLDEISNEPEPFLGYFNPPGERNAGIGVFNGDIWDRSAGGSLEAGGYDFVTITHELLHGLGMAHPHDDGGGSDIFQGVFDAFDDYGDFDLNQGIFTTMSYNTGFPGTTPGAANNDWGYEAGPMALDIAVLQDKYGANTTTASGDTVYTMPGQNAGGTFWQAIWDAGGEDTIRYDGNRDAVIDLRPATLQYEFGGGGFVSQATNIAGGFTIAAGVMIENAIGGGGDDRVVGNDGANALSGMAGFDVITAKDGDDVLTGGADLDWLVGNDGADTFVYTSVSDSGVGQGARDLINGFENGVDLIDLSAIDADPAAAGDQAFEFIGTAAFDGAGVGQVSYATWASLGVWNIVSIDADGDGTADMQIFVNLTDTMSASDFIL